MRTCLFMLFGDEVMQFWAPGKSVYLETALPKIHVKSTVNQIKIRKIFTYQTAYLESL